MASIEQHDECADTTYQKTTVVSADIDTVWEFYDTVDELRVLTPNWIGLRITKVTDENGEPVKESYHVGNRLHLESQPLNCGWLPEIEWVVEITDRQVGDRERYFVDEQVSDRGPYETWRHTPVRRLRRGNADTRQNHNQRRAAPDQAHSCRHAPVSLLENTETVIVVIGNRM